MKSSSTPAGEEPASTAIKIELKSEDGKHTAIDYIEDEDIKPDELRRVARAVVDNEMKWLGRGKMCRAAKVSQPKYTKIRDELLRLNYVVEGPGNTTAIGLRGRSFLRQLAEELR